MLIFSKKPSKMYLNVLVVWRMQHIVVSSIQNDTFTGTCKEAMGENINKGKINAI